MCSSSAISDALCMLNKLWDAAEATRRLYISATVWFRVCCGERILDVSPCIHSGLRTKIAREEFMLNELSNDPIQTAIAKMERQHEEDKQGSRRAGGRKPS